MKDNRLPQKLVYKIHVLVRTGLTEKGGLIATVYTPNSANVALKWVFIGGVDILDVLYQSPKFSPKIVLFYLSLISLLATPK
jgi:hypothetical protein